MKSMQSKEVSSSHVPGSRSEIHPTRTGPVHGRTQYRLHPYCFGYGVLSIHGMSKQEGPAGTARQQVVGDRKVKGQMHAAAA